MLAQHEQGGGRDAAHFSVRRGSTGNGIAAIDRQAAMQMLRAGAGRGCPARKRTVFLPCRSDSVLIGEAVGTTSAVHSGREEMYGVRIGLPLALASTAARPAVEPMSIPLPFRYSSARLLPALNAHLIAVPSFLNSSSNQPTRRRTRLDGE